LLWLLNKVGDQAAADRALAAGLARCPNSPALHLERGRRFKSAGKFSEALAALDVARKLRPQEVDSYVESAEIFFRLNRIDDAVTQLRAGLAAVPEHPVALFLLARHAIDSGDESAAIDFVRRARAQVRISTGDLTALEQSFLQRFGRRP
jgi:predicted Zn-dependent protease